MAKDVNIHVKTPGAAQARQQLDTVGKSAKGVGDKTATGQKRAADSTDKATGKLTGMGRILGNLKTQVLSFIGAWFGLQAVQKVVTYLIQKLERVAQLQQDIYEKSLSLLKIGQALEIQTGTLGKQQYWAEQAVKVQKAGALVGPQVAQQMMVSMDIAFAKQGGIKNQQIMDLAMQLAPFVGAAGLGPEEVSKIFEFAGAAGIAPTQAAYKDYFAKLMAGYTSSKATDFGQFMIGLQKGGTAYMTMGGTLEEAISAFAAARAVMPNEALASTLVEQAARIAGGGYEKPRIAMEAALGVKWSDLSMDQRMRALLQHVRSIPEATRAQTLAEQGFPMELTTQLGKMVSPEAIGTMRATRKQVTAATPEMIEQITDAYLKSDVAKELQVEAKIGLRKIQTGPKFADWQQRLKEAKDEFEDLAGMGLDRWIKDSIEPHVMAFEEMGDELLQMIKTLPPGPLRKRAARLRGEIFTSLTAMTQIYPATTIIYPKGLAARRGYQYTERLKAIREAMINQEGTAPPEPETIAGEPPAKKGIGPVSAATTINQHFDNSTHYYPRVGYEPEPRVGRYIT